MMELNNSYQPNITGLINTDGCSHRFKVYGLPQFNCGKCGVTNPDLADWDGDWSTHPWLEYFSMPQLQRYYARGSISKNGKRLNGAPSHIRREYDPGVLKAEELRRRYRLDKQTMRAKDNTKRGRDTADLTGKRKLDSKIKFTVAVLSNSIVIDVELGLTPDQVQMFLLDHGVRVERSKLDAMLMQCMSGRTFATKTAKENIRLQIAREGM